MAKARARPARPAIIQASQLVAWAAGWATITGAAAAISTTGATGALPKARGVRLLAARAKTAPGCPLTGSRSTTATLPSKAGARFVQAWALSVLMATPWDRLCTWVLPKSRLLET